MTIYYVPISFEEVRTLRERALPELHPLPMATWNGGYAIYASGDGTARWALAELALIRHGLEKRT